MLLNYPRKPSKLASSVESKSKTKQNLANGGVGGGAVQVIGKLYFCAVVTRAIFG